MAEQYGERLAYMLVMYVEGQCPEIPERSGAWVYVPDYAEKPDYRVVAIQRWRHTVIQLEKVMP